jgi:5-methylcytosine-specific restriction endonuclease McrA
MKNPAYSHPLYITNRAICLARDKGQCHWCGGMATTADHVVALAEGGTHDLANLVAACRRCNSSRGAVVTNAVRRARRVGRRSRTW